MNSRPSSEHRVQLILASSSPYRRTLLDRLGLSYAVAPPDCDETRWPEESAAACALRLARLKASTVADSHPDGLIIGSDQLAESRVGILGKPGGEATAVKQLSEMAGTVVTFHTGICLLDAASGRYEAEVVPYSVKLRALPNDAILRYVRKERPFDCAGGFKAEGLGIALFEWMRGDDPTALIGLPLIALTEMLQRAGVSVP